MSGTAGILNRPLPITYANTPSDAPTSTTGMITEAVEANVGQVTALLAPTITKYVNTMKPHAEAGS